MNSSLAGIVYKGYQTTIDVLSVKASVIGTFKVCKYGEEEYFHKIMNLYYLIFLVE